MRYLLLCFIFFSSPSFSIELIEVCAHVLTGSGGSTTPQTVCWLETRDDGYGDSLYLGFGDISTSRSSTNSAAIKARSIKACQLNINQKISNCKTAYVGLGTASGGAVCMLMVARIFGKDSYATKACGGGFAALTYKATEWCQMSGDLQKFKTCK